MKHAGKKEMGCGEMSVDERASLRLRCSTFRRYFPDTRLEGPGHFLGVFLAALHNTSFPRKSSPVKTLPGTSGLIL